MRFGVMDATLHRDAVGAPSLTLTLIPKGEGARLDMDATVAAAWVAMVRGKVDVEIDCVPIVKEAAC